jgi:hypothetical protein
MVSVYGNDDRRLRFTTPGADLYYLMALSQTLVMSEFACPGLVWEHRWEYDMAVD